MIRAFKLEWLKLRNYKFFWILLGLNLIALLIISTAGVFFLNWLKSEGIDIDGIDPTIIPIYDFPDIWQNTTYLASWLRFLLAFIVIISVNNDLTYNTMRQNVIDGVSKKEFVLSKLSLILFLAALTTIFLFITGLIIGSVYSNVWGVSYIFDEMEFLGAYFLDIVVYCSFAFLIALFIKKSGFAIIALFLYTMFFEPLAAVFMQEHHCCKDTYWDTIGSFLPIRSIKDLISVPFGKYIFREIVDYVPLKTLLINLGWLAIYFWVIYRRLVKRDLK